MGAVFVHRIKTSQRGSDPLLMPLCYGAYCVPLPVLPCAEWQQYHRLFRPLFLFVEMVNCSTYVTSHNSTQLTLVAAVSATQLPAHVPFIVR
jgi:hypothetical protein